MQIPINTLSTVGTLIKTARPLVRRTRKRIQQYYTVYQQQYGNGQQQYGNNLQQYINGQQQYGNNLQQYINGQQYYTSGQKRYSIGRLNSNNDQDGGGEEFVHWPKRTQVTNRHENRMMRSRYKSEVYWYLHRFVTKYLNFCYESIFGRIVMVLFLTIIAQIADLSVIEIFAHILFIIHWKNQIQHFKVTT